jgi:hypothetical protein
MVQPVLAQVRAERRRTQEPVAELHGSVRLYADEIVGGVRA